MGATPTPHEDAQDGYPIGLDAELALMSSSRTPPRWQAAALLVAVAVVAIVGFIGFAAVGGWLLT